MKMWEQAPGVTEFEPELEYVKALKKKNVPCELHIFPEGRHGLGLLNEVPHTRQWGNLMLNWLEEFCF